MTAISAVASAETGAARDGAARRDMLGALAYAVGLSVYFFAVYGSCNAITARRADVGQAAFAWERYIPLLPAMIVPYMSIDLFFFAAPFLCSGARQRQVHARRVVLAITVAGACFLLFPLKAAFARPATVEGGLGRVFQLLYGFDQPYNLVPSLHMALRVLLWAIYGGATRGVLRGAIWVWFILIGASTLLTHQHQVIDVITGQMLGLVCLHVVPDESAAERGERSRRGGRIAGRYGLAALAAVAAAYLLRPWGWVMLWPAASMAVMAAAYAGVGPGVFRKRHGRLAASTYVVLGPYLLGAWLTRRYYKPRDAAFTRLGPGLLIGRTPDDREAKELIDAGVTAVLDLTAECSETARFCRNGSAGVAYENVPILDLTPPSPCQLAEAVRFVRQQHAAGRGGGVYIHCAVGYSRNACVAAAVLLASGEASTVPQAIAAIREMRPRVVIDRHHEGALQAFAARR